MAIGRNIIIFTLPFLGTIASVVLTLLVILGSTRNINVLNDLYFFKLDLSSVTTKTISGLDQTGISSTLIDEAVRAALSELGIADFYTAGLWGYCEGSIDSSNATNVTACSTPEAMWWMDVQKILDDSINNTSVNITLPSDLTAYNGTIKTASNAMFILYIIAICVLFIAFFAGCFAFHSRGASCCAALITLVGLIASLLSSGIATGMYIAIRNIVNDNASEYGLVASTNHTMLGLTWGATAAALCAFVGWILTICYGFTRKSRGPEKEPFIGYVPLPDAKY